MDPSTLLGIFGKAKGVSSIDAFGLLPVYISSQELESDLKIYV